MIKKFVFFFFIMTTLSFAGLCQNFIIKPALVDYSKYIVPLKLKKIELNTISLPNSSKADTSSPCSCGFYAHTLPITLLYFNAIRVSNENVLLNWKTTNEIQNKGFNVERSIGNPDLFEFVAFVPAQPNNNIDKTYRLLDKNNYEVNSYYRLKQIDIDNKFVYSEIEVVKGNEKGTGINLYPNPAKITLTITANFIKKDIGKLLLYDVNQKLIQTQSITLNKGYNLYNIPVGFLTPGIYYIKIIGNDGETLLSSFIKE